MPAAELTSACPVCCQPVADEPACAGCGWTLSSGWILGPVSPAGEEEFRAQLARGQRRFDLMAAARAAGFPDAGDPRLLDALEPHLRGGLAEPDERDHALAALRAMTGEHAAVATRELARRAGASSVAVVELDAEGIELSTFEPAGEEPVHAGRQTWAWGELLPGLAGDEDARRLQLAGGVGTSGLLAALADALPELRTGDADVVLACRVPGWPVPERALELLAERLPQAERVWGRRLGDDGPSLIRTPAAITAFDAAGDSWVVTGHADGSVTVWAPPSAKPFASRRLHAGRVTALAIDREGTAVISGGKDGAVQLWAPAIGRTRLIGRHDGWVNAVRLAGDRVFSLGDDGQLRAVSLTSAPAGDRFPLNVGWSASTTFALTGRGDRLAVAGTDGRVVVIDARTGEEVRTVAVGAAVTALAFDPEGSRLVAGRDDGTIVVLGAHDGAVTRELAAGAGAIGALAVTASGGVLAGDETGAVRARPPDAEEWQTIGRHDGAVRGVAAGEYGPAISGGADGVIASWRLERR